MIRMNMKTRFQMTWNPKELAKAFKVSVDDVREYLTDGRRVSFIIERRLRNEHEGWKLAPSEGAGYDLLDPNGGMWEVRSITRGGVYFNPSNQVGSGRSFNEIGFRQKLAAIEGFILSDITTFPHVEVYMVPFEQIIEWYEEGKLGANARVSRKKFLEMSADLFE